MEDYSETQTRRNNLFEVIKELDSRLMNPKKILQAFLDSKNGNMIQRRSKWFHSGWLGTQRLLQSIESLGSESTETRQKWESFILEQAAKIVQRDTHQQRLHQFVSSKTITHKFFEKEECDKRDESLKKHMSFLYSLIERTVIGEEIPESEVADDEGEDLGLDGENEGETRDEGAIYLEKKLQGWEKKRNRGAAISQAVSSMVMYACNNKYNAHQVENGLILTGSGVSKKVMNFLQYMGLTVTQETVRSALKTLSNDRERELKELGEKTKNSLGPLICIDNLDFKQHVEDKKVEKESKIYHGTWGYINFIPDHLKEGINPPHVSLHEFENKMKDSLNKPVNPESLLPTLEAQSHWKLTVKSQIINALIDNVEDIPQAVHECKTKPPKVDVIPAHKPNLMMLKLMDASDDSSGGMGQVINAILEQMGSSPESFSEKVQIIEGDLATCKNIYSLAKLRAPSNFKDEALENVLPVLGAAHTLWNFAQAIYLSHWGDSKNSRDVGLWRTVQALGINSESHKGKKNFTGMISNMSKAYNATLINCMLDVLGVESLTQMKEKLETQLDVKNAVNKLLNKYFDQNSFNRESKTKNSWIYQLMLRLQDLATVVEANNSIHDGDIGRLIYMWERWALMASALNLKHYAIALPRLILLLKEDLSGSLAKIIKHTILISPSGHPGHFVAEDFYLETQNYWIKYFYNTS